jgi:hypothetical protein
VKRGWAPSGCRFLVAPLLPDARLLSLQCDHRRFGFARHREQCHADGGDAGLPGKTAAPLGVLFGSFGIHGRFPYSFQLANGSRVTAENR